MAEGRTARPPGALLPASSASLDCKMQRQTEIWVARRGSESRGKTWKVQGKLPGCVAPSEPRSSL